MKGFSREANLECSRDKGTQCLVALHENSPLVKHGVKLPSSVLRASLAFLALQSTTRLSLGSSSLILFLDAQYRAMVRSSPGQDDAATPLVRASHDPETLLAEQCAHRGVTPLPLLQLLILAMVRLAEPISITQVKYFGEHHRIKLTHARLYWSADISIC
jgi:hypothetical protein